MRRSPIPMTHWLSLAVLVCAAGLALVACGGSRLGSSARGVEPPHRPTSGIAGFGTVAHGAERRQILGVLRGYSSALRAGRGGEACARLSGSLRAEVVGLVAKAGSRGAVDCAEVLASTYAGRTAGLGPESRIQAVRADPARAFVIYRPAGEGSWFFPLVREGRDWLLAAIAGSQLPPPPPPG